MSWLREHATELSAMAGVFMSLATMVVVYFNVNQLRLNNRSLNVDINFKVFELRKNLYKEALAFISCLTQDRGLRQHLVEMDNGEFETSVQYKQLKEYIDNYKYLFSHKFAVDLETLILNIEKGIRLEHLITKLKNKDASLWSMEDQNEMYSLGHKLKEITNAIIAFDLDNFLPYLNVSNFHRNLMHAENANVRNKIITFSSTILLVKRGAALIPRLINNQKLDKIKRF